MQQMDLLGTTRSPQKSSSTKPAGTAKPRKAKRKRSRRSSTRSSRSSEPKPDRIYTTKRGKRYVLRQLAD